MDISSAVSGLTAMATTALSNPFDMVRVRMQTCGQLLRQGSLQRSYEGVIDCAKRVWTEEGVRAFWKGNWANVLRFYPNETLNYCIKEVSKKHLQKKPFLTDSKWAQNIVAGVVGAWTTLLVFYPLEYFRNVAVSTMSGKVGILSCIRDGVREKGWRGIYKGISISLIGTAIYRGSYFGIYDSLKPSAQSGLQAWSYSYLANLTALALTYPADTVRRRLIIMKRNSLKAKTFWPCFNQMLKSEGVGSLFKGMPIIFAQALSGSTILFLYDRVFADIRKMYE